jgi:hypothetical protein
LRIDDLSCWIYYIDNDLIATNDVADGAHGTTRDVDAAALTFAVVHVLLLSDIRTEHNQRAYLPRSL